MSGVYIHIPFCVSKCKYCDFVSGVFDVDYQKRYFAALFNEIKEYYKDKEEKVDTVFIGGGTPSSVDSKYIAELMDVLSGCVYIKKDAEITIEMNPGTVTQEKCVDYITGGINRFSIGLQSHDDDMLRRIGRIHTKKDFESTVDILDANGVKNISADIIYGLPDQSCEMVEKTAEYLLKFPLKHISAYALKIEEGTVLYDEYMRGEFEQAEEDIDRKMYYLLRERFLEKGYEQYEISNFAKAGFESRHNLKYWTLQDYRGFGAGAHSCIRRVRFANTSDIERYIAFGGICVSERTELSISDIEKEFIMLYLRLKKGFSVPEYEQMFACDIFERYGSKLSFLIENGFIKHDNDRIFLTEKGMDVQNAVLIKLGV